MEARPGKFSHRPRPPASPPASVASSSIRSNSTHLCLGGVTHGDGSDGLFVSRNGGLSWARLTFPGSGSYRCHAIVFHPEVRGTLFATVEARGARNGIWKSTDGGGSWTHLTNGLPSPDQIGRTSLAIAPSNPSVIYALSADDGEGVLGVFRSDDGGASWEDKTGDHFDDEDQMSYGNTIAVHPKNPDHVLCGGVDLHLTQDGGKTWAQVTRWDAVRGKPRYAHADHHCLVMPKEQPGLVYDMNDGGMDVSFDGGLKWTNRSSGLAVTMFYDVDVGQSDGRMFGGGAQDNGTVATLAGNITTDLEETITLTGKPDSFVEITGGDGGWISSIRQGPTISTRHRRTCRSTGSASRTSGSMSRPRRRKANATPYGWCLRSSTQRTPARCFWAACVFGARRTTEEPGATYRMSSMEVRSRRWRSRRPTQIRLRRNGKRRNFPQPRWRRQLERRPCELGSARVYRHPHHHQSDQCQGGLCDGGQHQRAPRLPVERRRVDLDRHRPRTIAGCSAPRHCDPDGQAIHIVCLQRCRRLCIHRCRKQVEIDHAQSSERADCRSGLPRR